MFSVPFTGHIKVDVSRQRLERLPHLNSDARRRTTAGRHINDGVRDMIEEIQRLADAELREARPGKRRRTDGPRYRDSFRPLPNTQASIDKLVGGFESTHHFAWGIERGTPEHQIVAVNKPRLAFPFDPTASRSRRGGPPGTWPILFTKDNGVQPFSVTHPGTPEFRFVQRARERYRRQARGRPRRRGVTSVR